MKLHSKDTRPCYICGKEVTRWISQTVSEVWFCSRTCANSRGFARPSRKRASYVCSECGKRIERCPSTVKSDCVFCSVSCYRKKQRRTKKRVTCCLCGRQKIVSPSQASRGRKTTCSPKMSGYTQDHTRHWALAQRTRGEVGFRWIPSYLRTTISRSSGRMDDGTPVGSPTTVGKATNARRRSASHQPGSARQST